MAVKISSEFFAIILFSCVSSQKLLKRNHNKVVNVKKRIVEYGDKGIEWFLTRFVLYDYCFQPKLSFHYSTINR